VNDATFKPGDIVFDRFERRAIVIYPDDHVRECLVIIQPESVWDTNLMAMIWRYDEMLKY
jgi:hypothetical protein